MATAIYVSTPLPTAILGGSGSTWNVDADFGGTREANTTFVPPRAHLAPLELRNLRAGRVEFSSYPPMIFSVDELDKLAQLGTIALVRRVVAGATALDDQLPDAEQTVSSADERISQLLQFQGLADDWDGSGAARPIAESLEDAREFIRALAPESIMPLPALHADGTAVLLVRDGGDYAELAFHGSKRVGYYARRGSQEWCDDFSFNNGLLPDGLSEIGFILG